MTIKKDTMQHVAKLARIYLDPGEEELFAKQLTDILQYMDKLNTLATDDVEPMSHAISMGNVIRKDVVKDSLNQEEALKNAPDKENGHFKVPKIIE